MFLVFKDLFFVTELKKGVLSLISSQITIQPVAWPLYWILRSKRFLFSSEWLDQPWGPPSFLMLGLFPGIKWLWCEVDHSSLSSAKFENDGRYTCTPSMFLCNVTRTTFTSASLLPYLTIDCFFFGRISTYADISL